MTIGMCFERTVDWAIEQGITTATFHIQTPYPGTKLFARMERSGRITHRNWDLYDTRHVVFRPRGMTPEALKDGYDWAYREFYRWPHRAGVAVHGTLKHQAKHFFYAAGWKKFERLWDFVIRARQLAAMTPVLEAVLSRVTRSYGESRADDPPVCQSEHVTSLAPGDSAPDPSVAPLRWTAGSKFQSAQP